MLSKYNVSQWSDIEIVNLMVKIMKWLGESVNLKHFELLHNIIKMQCYRD